MHYGFVHAANTCMVRRRLWASLIALGNQNICFMGDFNAIVGKDEQFGQHCLSRISCDEFRQCISDSGLVDLEATGPFFTWRCSHVSRVLLSRLDRTLAAEEFINFWTSISALVLPRTYSDHHPILLECQENSAQIVRPFRFQNFWTTHKDFCKVVSESWGVFVPARDPITVCIRKLKRLKLRLKEWSKQAFGNVFLRLEELQHELGLLQQRDYDIEIEQEHFQKEKELMLEISEILKQQHSLLSQKSRVHWLVDGD